MSKKNIFAILKLDHGYIFLHNLDYVYFNTRFAKMGMIDKLGGFIDIKMANQLYDSTTKIKPFAILSDKLQNLGFT